MYKNTRFQKKWWINLILSLLGTLLVIGLLPLILPFLVVTAMAYDSPQAKSEWVAYIIINLALLVPLSCLVSPVLTWINFSRQKTIPIILSSLLPVAAILISFLADVIVFWL